MQAAYKYIYQGLLITVLSLHYNVTNEGKNVQTEIICNSHYSK